MQTKHHIKLGRVLLSRLGAWTGLVSIALTMLVPAQNAFALGAQLTTRSATVNNSAPAATAVTYAVSFKTPGSGEAIGAFKFEVCDSPLESVSCVASASAGVNSNGASLAGGGATAAISGTGLAASMNKGATTGPGTSGTSVIYSYPSSPSTETGQPQITVTVTGVTNPAGANQEYYLRTTVYSNIAASTETDFGAVALGTGQVMNVTANVQEDLTFAVGNTGTTCALVAAAGATVTLSPNPMGSTTTSSGTGKLCASTNAASGYAIAYNATGFVGPSQTITAAATGGSVSATGGEQFGFTMTNQTSGNLSGLGAAPTGGLGVAVSPYASANSTIAYNTAGATAVANSAGSPTAQTVYTVLYAANISAITKPGTYVATQTFIATGTF